MPRIFGCFACVALAIVLTVPSLVAAQAAPVEQITRDAKGRVVSRRATNADKTGHRTLLQYATDSEQPLVVVDEDFDRLGQLVKRVEQRFDGQGRIMEKVDVRIDAAGKQAGTRTRYQYDQSGARTEEVIPVN